MLSSFATSMVFTVVMSAMLYFAGHLVPVAQKFYATSKMPLGRLMSGIVNWVMPNLAAFDVADDLLEYIFDGDEACHASKFIDHQGHVVTGISKITQQVV